MLFSWNISPSPSPTESKRLFYTSVIFPLEGKMLTQMMQLCVNDCFTKEGVCTIQLTDCPLLNNGVSWLGAPLSSFKNVLGMLQWGTWADIPIPNQKSLKKPVSVGWLSPPRWQRVFENAGGTGLSGWGGGREPSTTYLVGRVLGRCCGRPSQL